MGCGVLETEGEHLVEAPLIAPEHDPLDVAASPADASALRAAWKRSAS